jgi:Raf kinase inhibitor-like YbhB/YbcL family protein
MALKVRSMAGALVALVALVAMTMAASPAVLAQAPQGRGGMQRQPPLVMTTTAFEDGGVIPDKFTQAAGADAVSPALSWSQVPEGTQSFVLLMHDPEPVMNRSAKMDVTHWLVWNIPASSTGLPEGMAQGELADGTRQVSLRANAYMGPGAPAGPYHHYTFELYAIDTKLDIPQGAPQQAAETRTAIFDAMDGHVLGKAILVGRFHR